jgi:SSS family transporter
VIDALVVVAYLAAVLWIGLRWSRGQGSAREGFSEFAVGGRGIPAWAVLFSIIAAETSAATFLGMPGEAYALRNWTYLQLVVGLVLGRVLVAWLFLKPYYEHGVFSIYEFLGVRFGPRTRQAASATFLVTRLLASGTRLYVAAIVLAVLIRLLRGEAMTQGEELALYLVSIVAMTALTAIYTALGGIRAVIWTDVLQSTLMIGGAVVACWVLVSRIDGGLAGAGAALGGFSNIQLWEWGGNLRQVLEAKYTVWAAFIASTVMTMATHGTDQDMVQRMLCAPDVKKSRRSLVLSGVADLPIVFLFLSVGLLLWVFYQQRPDPELPAKTNEIFAYFILKEMPRGLRGLLIAGVFATAMGSLSAALNALATSFVRDWHFPLAGRLLRGERGSWDELRAAKFYTVVFSVLMVLVAGATAYLVILEPESRIIPIALGVFGYTYGSLLGVFLLGTLTRTRGTDRGNLVAMLVGALVVCSLSGVPGFPRWEALPVISFPWRVLAGALVTFGVGVCFPRNWPRSV